MKHAAQFGCWLAVICLMTGGVCYAQARAGTARVRVQVEPIDESPRADGADQPATRPGSSTQPTGKAPPDEEVDAETAAKVEKLAAKLGSHDPAERRQVALELARFGPKAGAAVDGLEGMLSDSERGNCFAAFAALEAIGPKAARAFPAAMDTPYEHLRVLAVLRMREMARRHKLPAELPLAVYLKGVKDGVPRVRAHAAAAVGDLGKDGKPAVPALTKLLDERSRVEWAAAVSLGKIGPAAKSSGPGLVKLLKSSYSLDRKAAAIGLAKIKPTDNEEEIVTALAALLGDKREDVRWAGAWALGELGGISDGATAELIKALDDESDMVRVGAANALSKIDPGEDIFGEARPVASAEAVKKLLEMLDDENVRVRWSAIWALGEARAAAIEAVAALLKTLEDPRSPGILRAAAANALGKIGLVDGRVLPALRAATKDKDKKVRQVALERVVELEKQGEPEEQSPAPTASDD